MLVSLLVVLLQFFVMFGLVQVVSASVLLCLSVAFYNHKPLPLPLQNLLNLNIIVNCLRLCAVRREGGLFAVK